jgi:hypothetical protein
MAAKKQTKPKAKAKKCACIAQVNAAAREQGWELDLAMNLRGDVWPVIKTKKLDGASPRAKVPMMKPSFCPFCGKKYFIVYSTKTFDWCVMLPKRDSTPMCWT